MKFARVIVGLAIATFSVLAYGADKDAPIASIDAYVDSLRAMVPDQGELYCESSSDGQRHRYDSCESFSALQDRGCFGYSTYDMSLEMSYESMCTKLSALSKAHGFQHNYFAFESEDWWKPLPAALIPMAGGIYSDESWAIAAAKREELVADRLLGELPFSEIESSYARFSATLETTELECGEIRNRLEMAATLLADFDGDGVAEALLEGYRVDRSATCSLGTGSALGASFSVLVKKDGPDAQIVVLKIPGIGLATDR